jgi:hypothetical protein
MKGRAKIPRFSHERLLAILDYTPETGVFVWKISPAKNVKSGSVAGGDAKGNGYRYIRVDGEEVTAARLAWFYVKREWPERRIRFINDDKTDHRFENLTLYDGIAGEFDHKTREGKLAYLKKYRSLNPENEKSRSLRGSFGISLDDYVIMLNRQNGKCAICGQAETHKRNGRVKALAVDHDHKSGKIRGLLCSDCNTGIGKLKDDQKILRKAADYLDNHSDPQGHPSVRSLN